MFRKGISILLAILVVFFTTMSLLAIWDLIKVEDIVRKSLSSLFIIFISATVMLFIFSVLYKGGDDKNTHPNNNSQ